MSDCLDLFVRFLARDAIGNGNVEDFALAHIGDSSMAQTAERRADRLALRVENRGFEGYEDACFHRNSIIARQSAARADLGHANR